MDSLLNRTLSKCSICLDNITLNSMKQGKERWINNIRLKRIKALQIQRHWRNSSCNPVYKMAQRLIEMKLK